MARVDRFDKEITTLVTCLDVVIVNIIFLVFRFFWINNYHQIIECRLLLMLFSISVSYVISSLITGVNFFYRRVRADQIVRKTALRVILFMFVWLFVSSIMEVGVSLDRSMVLYFTITTFVVIALRLGYNSFLKFQRMKGRNRCNVVYIGSGSNLMELYDEMANQLTTGYNVLGYFDKAPNPKFDNLCNYLGDENEIVNYLSRCSVNRVYCGLPSSESDVILQIINYCEGHLIRFFSVPNFRNYCQRRVSLEMFSNVPLLTIRDEPLSFSVNRFIKRSFDVAFSLCFLITVFLPIFIVVGIITKITSPGPIFFKQKRHGLDGKEFYIYKFRSMKVNADSDTKQATADDPRKTKFGDFLRKSSLDELPQFINVFLGDMSIVGPRPHMIKHTEKYSKLIKTYMVRHLIKPGITGWAQVTGFRGETKELSEMEGRVKADIWYMEHWTFTLDLYIIYKTVANVVSRKDTKAY